MSVEDLLDTSACGCCEVAASPTPEEIRNRPELTAIRYRIGTFSGFRQAMIEAISTAKVEIDGNTLRPLEGWTARTGDDYGIAVLEMWAYVADILTFYQERIANESFLRTALLRESVLRLAALLDYEPAPGVAATAHLAFTLEKNQQVNIPFGLLVQSVPGQDEEPQKFETVEIASTTSRLNKLRIYPEPTQTDPFVQTSTEAILKPSNAASIAGALAPGDSFVLFDDTWLPAVEEKRIDSIRVEDGRTFLSWSPEVKQDFKGKGRAFKVGRKLRIFGYNAPKTYLKPTQAADGSGVINWELVEDRPDSDYDESGSLLSLDGRYDDLKLGTRLLFHGGSTPVLLTISTVGQGPAELDPLSDTVTQITVSETLPSFDRRDAILYELSEPEIVFWGCEYADDISGDVIVATAEDLTDKEVEAGRALILSDGDGKTELVNIQTVEPVFYGEAEYLRISFTPSLTHPLDGETAVLYGNVAEATHGETVDEEVLGSGDASTTFQSFQLGKSPVTFVPQPGVSHGAANSLQVRIGGVLWHEVDTLFGRANDERVYTTSVDDENAMTARFGNGVEGARLPTGRNNVVAAYRQGLGRDGNVRAGTLTSLLDRPVGLKSVTNPTEARGGADPESLDEARTNAPNTVRTFGRIVSLRDFEDAAREFAGVAKARAAPVWDGLEQMVRLTVAGDEGAAITGEPKKNLERDLDSRRDANRKLVVETYDQVFVRVEAVVYVDPDFVGEDVRAAARAALLGHFAFDSLDLGQQIHLSDVYRTLQDVGGVVAVDVDRLQFEDPSVRTSHGATDGAVQGHLRIFPKELASIRQPLDDAVVRIGTRRA
jgi:uncharacterized phage protein gp47/JayE